MDMKGFDELADLALRKSGQAILRSQVYLIKARLGDILRRENFSTLEELSECLRARPNLVLEDEIIAAMATKSTVFFHDRGSLEYITDIALPAAVRRQQAKGQTCPLRVLCAGGGTGQEAYSLAILLEEADQDQFSGRKIELTSVDFCKTSTARAEAGIYGHYEIQMGLSVHRMLKYFTRKDEDWVLSGTIRQRVNFEIENLMQPFDGVEAYDVILCRNVLPLMARPIAQDLALRLGRLLGPDGILFTSSAESLHRIDGFMSASADLPAWSFDPVSSLKGVVAA